MRGATLFIGIILMFTAACGAPAPEPQFVDGTLPAPTATSVPPTATITPTLPPGVTPVPATSTPAATPTETLLPPLDLPTLSVNPPALAVWDGTPTYLADSQPGYAFRVRYDPEVWGLVQDQLGQPALGHRSIPYCIITPTAGRGLPPTLRVEHEIIYPEELTIDVGRAYQDNEPVFVAYLVSDGTTLTGFQVDFEEQSEACLADALAVITTLRSIPLSQATPAP